MIPIELEDWFTDNKINYKVISSYYYEIIGVGTFFHLTSTEGKIFTESFSLFVDDTVEYEFDFVSYSFGGKFYYEKKEDIHKPKLNLLKYLGNSIVDLDVDFSYLGVHGKYELLNGSRDYKDWCKKAKFLGVKTLGICEKNTLAGVIPFQISCNKNDIKPVIGISIVVKIGSESNPYILKLYCENDEGWNNILNIHKEISIINTGFIYEKDLLKYLDNIVCVIDPKYYIFDKLNIKKLKDKTLCFYQLDTVEFSNNDRDKWYLENLKKFVNSDTLEPILICDSYYLDKDEYRAKKILNSISNNFDYESKNQYFKNLDDIFSELSVLFNESDDRLYDIFQLSLENVNKVSEICDFNIDTKSRHLPKYIMNEDEKEKFETNEDLFWHLIEEGFSERVPKGKEDLYMERMQMEYEVVQLGNVLDYFLILYDVIRYCRDRGILTGHSRGCFIGDTLINLCNGGKIKIKDINIGDVVRNSYYGSSIVLDKFEYDIEEELVELYIDGRKIVCTKDHKFLTDRGWIEADNLNEKDEIKFCY